ncbi:group I truncated hemoglobin [Thalassotalea marina]|uniref:Cyanoglobin n=1 Tax=Thalassotalea marina TaxID=1673741 RepID=A0A919BQ76_9GAMM|nr:group 1 truncated hemoglobin [Thalassotalea marina]GHG04762.1 cyanoglobin [Thalassotalea marina]
MKRIIPLTLCLLSFLGCSSKVTEESLYQQLNGQPGIEKIVDSFIQQIAKDKQIFPYFAKASVSHFRQGFITHLCDVSGGPCQYQGDNMNDIHTGMQITEADFNRVVELLINAMEENNITYPAQNRVLALLAPLRAEVIKI